MKKIPKYSIIIPTYNGIQYLPTCIETIISQDYKDYELIISDDHSTDGTKEFLETLSHPNITVVYPPESLSMTEHWEWALSYATGEWQIFVGQDDGLQPYFFQLADRLTLEAKEKKLRTIMSSRAYFFWKGCEYVYGDRAVIYTAINKTKVHNFTFEAFKALFGVQTYFELPQMYTTALFHKDLLKEARSKQNGSVFSCHPQDANLAAISCSLEKEYLKSYIPLGWVGTSPKSAGMAISGDHSQTKKETKDNLEKLKKVYIDKIFKSKFMYHRLAGEFSFGHNSLYFWQALLMTFSLRKEKSNNFLTSNLFKFIFFGSILFKLNHSPKFIKEKERKINDFKKILTENNCNFLMIKSSYLVIYSLTFLWKIPFFIYRVFRKIYRLLSKNRISYKVRWSENDHINMIDASQFVNESLCAKNWILKNEKEI